MMQGSLKYLLLPSLKGSLKTDFAMIFRLPHCNMTQPNQPPYPCSSAYRVAAS